MVLQIKWLTLVLQYYLLFMCSTVLELFQCQLCVLIVLQKSQEIKVFYQTSKIYKHNKRYHLHNLVYFVPKDFLFLLQSTTLECYTCCSSLLHRRALHTPAASTLSLPCLHHLKPSNDRILGNNKV
jgi:hypothetical protein